MPRTPSSRSMNSLMELARRWLKKAPLQPLHFHNANFETVPASRKLEEKMHDISTGKYYPLKIGEILNTKYQVVGKLGFGLGSTVRLANDLNEYRTVALKMFTSDQQNRAEIGIYKHLASINSNHPGRRHIRNALDTLTLHGPRGEHECLVHEPMWENISASNVLVEIGDNSIITEFIKAEQDHPSPRKEVDGYTIYASRIFNKPRIIGEPILSDFGAAVCGDIPHNEDAQPDVYRSPEVCLEIPWSYSIDIWNLGVLIWDLFEGKHMFYGQDPIEEEVLTRAHLAEMIAMMGPPPLELLERGRRTAEFFTNDGQWRGEIPLPTPTSLEESEERLDGGDKEAFLHFMRKMLQWQPERRQTAKQLLQGPWLNRVATV